AHFDAGNDCLPILRRQPFERALVALHCFLPNRLLERRFRAIELETIKSGAIRLSAFTTQLVANAIEDCLPQIRLKRTDTAGLKAPNSLKRLEQGFLDKVIGIRQIARPAG